MPRRFRQAVAATPSIASAFRRGLQALEEADRGRVRCANTRLLQGSVHLDDALQNLFPNENRWDYGIGVAVGANSDRAVWIEVHEASSSHIDRVLRKLYWLRHWLKSQAPLLDKLTTGDKGFVWVASGKVSLQPHSPQRKKIAEAKLHFAGESFEIA
ncbi:MAG: hypothetical protein HYS13_05995 [Planctomycetia bacterium]|nr:hypothetical protein [Planctomycetia bacterium]